MATGAKLKLQELRKEAEGKIIELLKKKNIERLEITDVSEGDSPILQGACEDADHTYSLDRIILDILGNLTFEGSSAYDNIEMDVCVTPTDTLLDIAEWLEDYEDEIKPSGLTAEQKEGIEDEVDRYLPQVFHDAVERRSVVESLIDEIYEYILDTCEWDDYADDEYCISDVHIAVQSILYTKIVR
jgi:hypothetical protein